MFPVKKVSANGKEKFYIRYRNDEGKLLYYPKSKYPDFYSANEAQEWINKNRKKFTSIKKQHDILKKILAKKSSPALQVLLDIFEEQQMLEAPNSHQSSMTYMHRFVLDFYINHKVIYDINEWYLYFEEFRMYLEKRATVLGKKTSIQYSTKNHCIRTLNKFLTIMHRYHYLTAPPVKCRPFPKHKLNTRGAEDIISSKEYYELKEKLKVSRDFFIILYNTGMRFNELFSLSYTAVREPNEIAKHLVERFARYNKKIYGYISLDSQIFGKTRSESFERAKKEKGYDALYFRKPLKSCKDFSAKNRRIIPIFDLETWKILLENYNRCVEEMNEFKHGQNGKDYFLLDVEPNSLRREYIKFSKKGFHALRHSYITNMVGEFNDLALTRIVTGHRSDAFENYVHIYELYAEDKARNPKLTLKKFNESA